MEYNSQMRRNCISNEGREWEACKDCAERSAIYTIVPSSYFFSVGCDIK